MTEARRGHGHTGPDQAALPLALGEGIPSPVGTGRTPGPSDQGPPAPGTGRRQAPGPRTGRGPTTGRTAPRHDPWRLDARTRAVGLAGIRAARAALDRTGTADHPGGLSVTDRTHAA